jgi:hypothetical protein
MPIYMLNLVFNPTDAHETTDSRFLEFDDLQPNVLLQSEVWLMANTSSPNPDTAANWHRLEQDTSLLTLDVGDQVWIRVCGATPMAGYTARVTTSIARNAARASHRGNGKPYQVRASPFPIAPGSTLSCAVFDTINPTYQPPSQAGSWVQAPLIVTFTTPPPAVKPPGFHDSYSSVVAVTLVGPNGTQTYSHDPDMDVNC